MLERDKHPSSAHGANFPLFGDRLGSKGVPGGAPRAPKHSQRCPKYVQGDPKCIQKETLRHRREDLKKMPKFTLGPPFCSKKCGSWFLKVGLRKNIVAVNLTVSVACCSCPLKPSYGYYACKTKQNVSSCMLTNI